MPQHDADKLQIVVVNPFFDNTECSRSAVGPTPIRNGKAGRNGVWDVQVMRGVCGAQRHSCTGANHFPHGLPIPPWCCGHVPGKDQSANAIELCGSLNAFSGKFVGNARSCCQSCVNCIRWPNAPFLWGERKWNRRCRPL